uniref:Uncharacterized protein n=1 Tax=Capra hircus TaxID=9925 RepID=A0A452EIQ2_CAPHI
MMRPPLVPPLGPAPPGLFPPAPLPKPGGSKCSLQLDSVTQGRDHMIRAGPHCGVRQENKGAAAAAQRKSEDDSAVPFAKTAPKSGPSVPVSVQTKDDVCQAFMKEMEGLL